MSSGQSRSGDRDGGDRGDRGDRRPIGGGRGGQRRSKRYIFKVALYSVKPQYGQSQSGKKNGLLNFLSRFAVRKVQTKKLVLGDFLNR